MDGLEQLLFFLLVELICFHRRQMRQMIKMPKRESWGEKDSRDRECKCLLLP